jgi:hypothetical protein
VEGTTKTQRVIPEVTKEKTLALSNDVDKTSLILEQKAKIVSLEVSLEDKTKTVDLLQKALREQKELEIESARKR